MSQTVDEKVVKMQFDNAQFEEGVKTSMGTLERLKQSLKFNGTSADFSKIEQAAGNVKLTGLQNAVDSVNSKFSIMGTIGDQVIRNLTNSVMGLGSNMIHTVVNLAKTGGINRALNLENAKFQLAGLEIAWEKVEDSISAAVDGTAYGLDSAAKAASQLAASGVNLGEDMTKSLRAISGVAAMTNASYEEISPIFTTIAGQGKVMTMQLRQLEARGLNVAAKLGEKLGATEAEIRDAVTKGKIDFQTFANAMDDAFGEHAKDANKTFTGSLSNVKAALSRIGAKFATPGLENLRDIFNSLRPLINNVSKALDPLINQINALLGEGTKLVTSFLDNVDITGFTTRIEGLTKTLSSLFGGPLGNKNLINLKSWQKLETSFGKSRNIIIDNLKKYAQEHGLVTDEILNDNEKFLRNLTRGGWFTTDIFKDVLNSIDADAAETSDSVKASLEEITKMAEEVKRGDWGNGEERIRRLTEAGYDFHLIQSLVDHDLLGTEFNFEQLSDAQLKEKGYTDEQIESLKKLKAELQDSNSEIGKLISGWNKPTALQLFAGSLKNVADTIMQIMGGIRDAFTDTFFGEKSNGALYDLLLTINKFTEGLKLSEDEAGDLKNAFGGVFSVFKGIITVISKIGYILTPLLKLRIILLDVLGNVGLFISGLVDAVTGSEDFATAVDILHDALDWVISKLVSFYTTVSDSEILNFAKNVVHGFFEEIKKLNIITRITKFWKTLVHDITQSNLFRFLEGKFKKIQDQTGKFNFFDALISKIKNAIKFIKDFFSTLMNLPNVQSFVQTISEAFSSFGSFVSDKVIGAIEAVSNFKLPDLKSDGSLSVFEKLDEKFGVLTSTIDAVKKSLNGEGGGGKGIGSLFSSALEGMRKTAKDKIGSIVEGAGEATEGFGEFFGQFKDSLNIKNIEKVLGLVQGIFGAGILYQVGKLIKNMRTIPKSLGSIARSLKVLILSATAKNAADMVLKLAEAIGILALSLIALSFVPEENLEKALRFLTSLATIVGTLTVIIGAIEMLKNLTKKDKSAPKTIGDFLSEIKDSISNALNGFGKLTSALSIMVLIGSLVLLANALIKIAKLDMRVIMRNLGNFVIVFGALTALAGLTRLAGDNAGRFALTVLSFALSARILASALKIIAGINEKDANRAMAIVEILAWSLVGMMAVLSLLIGPLDKTPEIKALGTTALKMSVALYVIGMALKQIADIPAEDAKRATAIASVLLIVMGIASKLANSGTGSAATAAGIFGMAAIIGILSVCLKDLAELPAEQALASGIALGIVLGTLSLAMRAIASMKSTAGALVGALAMSAVIGVIAYVIYKLKDIPAESSLGTATALSEVLLAVSAAMAILTKFQVNPAQAATAALDVAAFLGVLITIFGTIGELINLFPEEAVQGLLDSLDLMAEITTKVGAILGGFVGGIVGGIASGATSTLPDIATNMTNFATNLTEFLNKIQDMDTKTAVSKVSDIGTVITEVSTATTKARSINTENVGTLKTAMEGLSSFMTDYMATIGANDIDVEKFSKPATAMAALLDAMPSSAASIPDVFDSETLRSFGASLTAYSDSISGLDEGKISLIETSATAAQKIIDIAALIPNSGGIFEAFTGNNNMSGFGMQMQIFGTALRGYSMSIDGIDTGLISKSATAAKKLIEIANLIPNSGGIIEDIVGQNDLGEFGMQMRAFGNSLKRYAESVDGLNTTAITDSAAAAGDVIDIAKKIPNSGGGLAKLIGDNDLAEFGVKMGDFGTALGEYAESVKGLDTGSIESSKAAALKVIDIANAIPTSGGLVSLVTGDADLSKFGGKMSSFGAALKEYAESVSGLDTQAIIDSKTAVDPLIEAATKLSTMSMDHLGGKNVMDFGDFSFYMQDLATAISKYHESLAEVDIGKLDQTNTVLQTLVNVATSLAGTDLTAINSLSEGLSSISADAITTFIDSFSAAGESLQTAASALVGDFASVFEKIDKSRFTTAAKNLVAAIVLALTAKKSSFQSAGRTLVSEFVKGVRSRNSEGTAAGQSLANSVANGLRGHRASFVALGIDMAEGLRIGIMTRAASVAAEAARMASNAVAAAKRAADSKSPSKKMIKLGEDYDRGMIIGFRNLAGKVNEAADSMAKSSLDVMRNTIAGIGASLANGLDMTPTIRPVMDMSEIQNGSDYINSLFANMDVPVGTTASLMGRFAAIDDMSTKGTTAPPATAYTYGDMSVIVNAAPGQDANEIADVVIERITDELYKEAEAFA